MRLITNNSGIYSIYIISKLQLGLHCYSPSRGHILKVYGSIQQRGDIDRSTCYELQMPKVVRPCVYVTPDSYANCLCEYTPCYNKV